MKKFFVALLLIPALALAVPANLDLARTWAVNHAPAAATKPTISKAAVAGIRHVATSATICVSGVAAQPDLVFNLRDGATGAGTVLWTARMAAVIGTANCFASPPFNIPGSLNTAMTLEAAAAPAATNFATVTLTGYDIAGE